MRKMTKKEALASFRELWNMSLENGRAQRGDSIMKRECWNDYLDGLIQSGEVPKNADEWSNPF